MISSIRNVAAGDATIEFEVVADASGIDESIMVSVDAETVSLPIQAGPYTTSRIAVQHAKTGQHSVQVRAATATVDSGSIVLYFKEPRPTVGWCDIHKKPKSQCSC